jgi:tRNA CCA-adding enzyme
MKNAAEPPLERKKIFHEVLKKITPSKEETAHFLQVESDLIKIIQESKIPNNIQIRYIEAQGSTGIKQTSLRDAADIDLFIGIDQKIIFDQGFHSKTKTREFLRILFKRFVQEWLIPTLKQYQFDEVKLSYAEHPYVSAKYQGIDLDLVVCFDLSAEYLAKSGPITSVDRTPHHSRFIRDTLSTEQRDDVRLLKHFLKCHHCYGDKSPVGKSGFIGYSAELLIAYFGSIDALFKNFKTLSIEPISIYHKNRKLSTNANNLSFQEFRKEFYPNDFLVILDPTDIKRNVGSSISERAYWCIESKITEFLQNPLISYFERESLPKINEMPLMNEERKKYYYAEYHRAQEDHYTKFRDKLYSFLDFICRDAAKELTLDPRFEDVIGELLFDADEGKYCIAFQVEQPELAHDYLRKGPKVGDEPHYSKFAAKYPNHFEKDGFLWVVLPRPFWEFGSYLLAVCKEKKIDNLHLFKIGQATDTMISEIAGQSMGNLYVNVVPFRSKFKK